MFCIFEVPAGRFCIDLAKCLSFKDIVEWPAPLSNSLSPNSKKVTGPIPQKTACSGPVSIVYHLYLALTLLCAVL